MEKLDDLHAMAYLYVGFRRLITSFPTSLCDFFQELPEGYSDVYELVEQADNKAQELGYS